MEKRVFEGIKVAEFGGFAAGPGVGKMMADFGAEVVRVESFARPDGFRTHYPPYTDNEPGLNRSGCFAIHNNNKYDITINLKASGASEIAQKVIAWADVVIENFTPGTMEKLGLGYEALVEIKPDLIMVGSCNQGQTGPHANHPGFGSQLTSLSGFTHLTGYPDDSPILLYGPYIDYIGVGYGIISVTAALDYRRRTGKGQYIDLAQYEGGLQFIAPVLLDYLINNRVATRMGNRHSTAAPHDVYPCLGEDRWCAIGIFSDREWEKLVEVMGSPRWTHDPKFSTLPGRKSNEDELYSHMAEWTASFTAEQLMERLQSVGLRAGVVNNMKDLYNDPQLKHRHIWCKLEHPEMGSFNYESPAFQLSETPAVIDRPSPCIGEHNYYFFTNLLGFSEDEYNKLLEQNIIG
ncbi:MAG: CoA transferase [Bacillota bacterium]|nr:CoA transferase [Bacillota bacterium]